MAQYSVQKDYCAITFIVNNADLQLCPLPLFTSLFT